MTVFVRLEEGSQRFALEELADCSLLTKPEGTQQKLHRVSQTVGGESCLGEHGTFDIGGHGFRFSVWLLRFAVVI